jgi:hypothetical protein
MRRYAIHNGERITQVMLLDPAATADVIATLPPGYQLDPLGDDQPCNPRTDYWSASGPQPRCQCQAALTGRVLSGVPAGARVLVDGIEIEAAGTDLYLDLLAAREYSISISAPGMVPVTLSIESDGPAAVIPPGDYTVHTVARYPTLAAEIAAACAEIDAMAGRLRATYITAVAGQAETYQAKLAEAQRWATTLAEQRAAGDWPWLTADSAALAITIDAAAENILDTAAAWINAGTAIETARLGSKRAIRAATTQRAAALNLRAGLELLEE